jgi:hypothetical protein
MKAELLTWACDILWLKQTHLKALSEAEKAEIQSAVIYGNEDSPEKVVCYSNDNPSIHDVPCLIFLPID